MVNFITKIAVAGTCLLMSSLLIGEALGQESDGSDRQVWEGVIDAGLVKLNMRLLVDSKDGKREATLISLDQGNAKIKVDAITIDDQSMNFTAKQVRGEFEGKLEGESFKGKWTQMGRSMPMTLTKVKLDANQPLKGTWDSRPQKPKPPFPYESTDVKFPSKADDVTLAGTLTLPKNPIAAVVLVSGSGLQDRDETLMGHKPFMVIADHFGRKGIAVLRYDDRGFGESTGDASNATSRDFALDTLGAIDFLAAHPDLKNVKLGIVGHSEGGLIAPLVATQSKAVKFNILLAGPGVTGNEIIRSQSKAISKLSGQPDNIVDLSSKTLGALLDVVLKRTEQADLSGAFQAAIDELLETLPESDHEIVKATAKVGSKQLNNSWTRFFVTYDPAPTLARNTCPTLALLGGKDLQVLTEPNEAPLRAALDKNGVDGNELIVFPEANHLFQKADTGLPPEYAKIEETMMPKVLEKMSSWIAAR